jgi:hypothetical protein
MVVRILTRAYPNRMRGLDRGVDGEQRLGRRYESPAAGRPGLDPREKAARICRRGGPAAFM